MFAFFIGLAKYSNAFLLAWLNTAMPHVSEQNQNLTTGINMSAGVQLYKHPFPCRPCNNHSPQAEKRYREGAMVNLNGTPLHPTPYTSRHVRL